MFTRPILLMLVMFSLMSTIAVASPRLNAQQLSEAANSHQQAAQALLKATYAQDVIEQALYQLKASYAHMIKDIALTREHRELETQYRDKAFALAKQQLNWAKIEPAFIELYLQTYTEQELKELTAFYQTDTGKKYLKHMPSTLRQASNIVQNEMQQINQQFSQIATQLATEAGVTQSVSTHSH